MIGEKVGSTIGHLNIEIFRKLIIPIPSSEEQTAIATVLSDMDSELESLEKKRDKYLMIKQGMMQQLLTGKIRLI
jgi:type I restriction enzyme S subunit